MIDSSYFDNAVDEAITQIKSDPDPDLVAIQALLKSAKDLNHMLRALLAGDLEFDKVNQGAYDVWDVSIETRLSTLERRELFRYLGA